MKFRIRHLVYIWVALLTFGLFLAACGDNTQSLGTAPAGFSYTDADGNPITTIPTNGTVYMKDAGGNTVLSFAVNKNVDLSGTTAARGSGLAYAHLANTNGLTGAITLFVPCGPTTNTLYITPGASSPGEVNTSPVPGTTVTLTIASPGPTEGYTWANAATRVGEEDCQVSANVADWNTGAAGSSVEGNGSPPTGPTVSYSATTFSESGRNDGTIGNIPTANLANTTFSQASGEFTLDTHYTVTGTVPSGLTFAVEPISTTQAKLELSGTALPHLNANDTSITLTFLAAAFTDGLIPVDGTTAQALSIDFDDAWIVLFNAGKYDGNLVAAATPSVTARAAMSGRGAADQLCQNAAYNTHGWTSPEKRIPAPAQQYFRGFISAEYTGGNRGVTIDQISSFASDPFYVPTDQSLRSLNKTQLKDNWLQITNGTLQASLSAAGVIGDSQEWWSGSTTSAQLGDNCNGWTETGAMAARAEFLPGAYGSANSTTDTWIAQPSSGDCSLQKYLLCIAFEPNTPPGK